MANKEVQLKIRTAAEYDVLYPKTTISAVQGLSSALASLTAHGHADLLNNGSITSTPVTPTTSDAIVMTDASATPAHALKRGPVFDATHNDSFLRKDGSWQPVPTTTHTHDDRYYTEAELRSNSILMRMLKVNQNGVPSNNLGDPTVAEMALFPEQFNNKTNFFPIANLTAETSTDGLTWTSFAMTDDVKRKLVGGDGSSSLTIPYGTFAFRFVLRATGYSYVNALYNYWSSNGHSTQVQFYKKHDSGSYTQHTSSAVKVSSWPGHLYMPCSAIPWHNNGTLGSHYHTIYVVYTPTWNASYPANGISIYKLQLWGGYPAGTRNVYSTNEYGSVTFPAGVTATTFSGALSGNAGSATYASAVTTTAENTGTTSRYILFANSASGNQALKTDTGLKYHPTNNALTATTFIGDLTGTASGNLTSASLVDASIPVMGIVQTLIKNISGKDLTNYNTDVSHMNDPYPYTLITYQSTSAITEAEAKTYMKSILGVTWLPQYDYDWPKNIYIIDGSGILWKPQWTNINNFLGIYELRMYYATKITTDLTLSSGTTNGTLKLVRNGFPIDNIAVKGLGSAAYTASTAYSASNHTHDDRYYTETEMDTLLSGKAASSHSHTWTQVPGVSGISVIGKSTAGGGSVSDLSMLTLQSMLSLGSAAYTASTAYKASSYVPSASDITGLDATHRWLTDNYITTWNNKEPAITKGTTSQYFRGDMSLANFPTTMTPAPHTHSEYVPTTRTISGKQLSGNIALYTEDIGDDDRHQYLNDTLGDLETSKLSNSDIVRSKNTLTVTSPGAEYSNNGLLVDLAANSTYKISMVGHWERQSPSTTAWAYRQSIISSATGVYMRGMWTWYQLNTSTGASTTIAYSDSMSASPGVTGQTVTTPTATTAVSNAPMCFEGYVVTGASSTTIRFSHGTSVSVYPPTRSAFRGVLTATKM